MWGGWGTVIDLWTRLLSNKTPLNIPHLVSIALTINSWFLIFVFFNQISICISTVVWRLGPSLRAYSTPTHPSPPWYVLQEFFSMREMYPPSWLLISQHAITLWLVDPVMLYLESFLLPSPRVHWHTRRTLLLYKFVSVHKPNLFIALGFVPNFSRFGSYLLGGRNLSLDCSISKLIEPFSNLRITFPILCLQVHWLISSLL